MNRAIAIVVSAIAVLVLGAAAWFYSQGDSEPTTDVTAPPITTVTTSTITSGSASTTSPLDVETTAPVAESVTFELTDEAAATFTLTEELRGQPTTVVGTSDIVVGQIEFDLADLAEARIGTILINARAFATDSSFRDRAVRGPILDTDAFEFIEFAPTSIEGLSGPAQVDEELSFVVIGDLTIRDVTNEVSFDVTATLVDNSTLVGAATTLISREAFGLAIPSVATVANVSDEVMLELSFAATP